MTNVIDTHRKTYRSTRRRIQSTSCQWTNSDPLLTGSTPTPHQRVALPQKCLSTYTDTSTALQQLIITRNREKHPFFCSHPRMTHSSRNFSRHFLASFLRGRLQEAAIGTKNNRTINLVWSLSLASQHSQLPIQVQVYAFSYLLYRAGSNWVA